MAILLGELIVGLAFSLEETMIYIETHPAQLEAALSGSVTPPLRLATAQPQLSHAAKEPVEVRRPADSKHYADLYVRQPPVPPSCTLGSNMRCQHNAQPLHIG
jgi:hypothetical protein